MQVNNDIFCSVTIATFKRPQLLGKLLESLLHQQSIDLTKIEIIIIDNDINQSAKPIVTTYCDKRVVNIMYYYQPIQNISKTRNIGIENAKGKYIAIVDDDEIVHPNWLSSLINAAVRYNADAVFGYVEALFPDDTPYWIKQREIYFKPMGETGSYPGFVYTTNCLINREILVKYNIRFDPSYGLSGGEDGFFFDDMRKFGAKFIVCREAISFELIPKYRTKLSFIFHRFFQRGNNYSINYLHTSNNNIIAWMYLFTKSISATIFYGLELIILLPFLNYWIYSFIDFSLNLGKIWGLFGFKKELYKYEFIKFRKDNE